MRKCDNNAFGRPSLDGGENSVGVSLPPPPSSFSFSCTVHSENSSFFFFFLFLLQLSAIAQRQLPFSCLWTRGKGAIFTPRGGGKKKRRKKERRREEEKGSWIEAKNSLFPFLVSFPSSSSFAGHGNLREKHSVGTYRQSILPLEARRGRGGEGNLQRVEEVRRSVRPSVGRTHFQCA